MNKILKLGIGLAAGAATVHIAYDAYQNLADNLRRDLIAAVRNRFSNLPIAAVWIFDDPDHGAIFKGGVIVKYFDESVKNLSFEIDAENLEITKISEEKI